MSDDVAGTSDSGQPDEEGVWVMHVSVCDLTEDEREALFDRVADAAHELDEQVACFGWTWEPTNGPAHPEPGARPGADLPSTPRTIEDAVQRVKACPKHRDPEEPLDGAHCIGLEVGCPYCLAWIAQTAPR